MSEGKLFHICAPATRKKGQTSNSRKSDGRKKVQTDVVVVVVAAVIWLACNTSEYLPQICRAEWMAAARRCTTRCGTRRRTWQDDHCRMDWMNAGRTQRPAHRKMNATESSSENNNSPAQIYYFAVISVLVSVCCFHCNEPCPWGSSIWGRKEGQMPQRDAGFHMVHVVPRYMFNVSTMTEMMLTVGHFIFP